MANKENRGRLGPALREREETTVAPSAPSLATPADRQRALLEQRQRVLSNLADEEAVRGDTHPVAARPSAPAGKPQVTFMERKLQRLAQETLNQFATGDTAGKGAGLLADTA